MEQDRLRRWWSVANATCPGVTDAAFQTKSVTTSTESDGVAVYGVNLAYLIGGTVLVENVFSLPGLGTLLVSSVSNRDYPVVQGVTLLFAVLIVSINLLTDVVQAALDPRVGQEIGA